MVEEMSSDTGYGEREKGPSSRSARLRGFLAVLTLRSSRRQALRKRRNCLFGPALTRNPVSTTHPSSLPKQAWSALSVVGRGGLVARRRAHMHEFVTEATTSVQTRWRGRRRGGGAEKGRVKRSSPDLHCPLMSLVSSKPETSRQREDPPPSGIPLSSLGKGSDCCDPPKHAAML